MLKLGIEKPSGRLLQVLFLGAHSDDIEIGCGGSVLRLIKEFQDINVWWVVFSGNYSRQQEAQKSAELFLQGSNRARIILKDFRDGYFPYAGAAVKDFFEELKQLISPDIIFTHYRNDLHQDHRLINELTWNTWRDHFILEYEVLKYDGDLGNPNYYVVLDEDLVERKVDCIVDCFQTQSNKHWFRKDTFLSISRLRGIECRSPSGVAEGFYCRKVVI